MWKVKERATFELVKQKIVSMQDLEWAADDFSRYDASSHQVIAEFKYRYGNYPDTMIEKMKYDNLHRLAAGRAICYCVEREDGSIFLFNINHLDSIQWDYNWHTRKCNETTVFERNEKIDKRVGMIRWDQARTTINRHSGIVKQP